MPDISVGSGISEASPTTAGQPSASATTPGVAAMSGMTSAASSCVIARLFRPISRA